MKPEEMFLRSAAVSRLKDAGLELWKATHIDIEEIQEMAIAAARGEELPKTERLSELARAARALADLDYDDCDIEWFSVLGIYDFQEWERERFEGFKERLFGRRV